MIFLNPCLLHCILLGKLSFLSIILDSFLCILNRKLELTTSYRYSYYAVLCLMVQLHSDMICSTLKIQFQHNLCLVWSFSHYTLQRKALQWCESPSALQWQPRPMSSLEGKQNFYLVAYNTSLH